MTFLVFTLILGSAFSANLIIPAYATGSSGQIHFFGHVTSGKPPKFTSPPGFEINQCAPKGSNMFEIDLYLLKNSGSSNTIRLTMSSGTDGSNYPSTVTMSSVAFKVETGISVGSENVDSSSPFDVLVPPAGEDDVSDIRAQSDPHLHLKITFNANGDKYYRIHGENLDVSGKKADAYFFYTDDPENCDDGPPPGEIPVGGEIIPINTTVLLLAGLTSNAAWMIPIFGAAGSLTYFIKFRTK